MPLAYYVVLRVVKSLSLRYRYANRAENGLLNKEDLMRHSDQALIKRFGSNRYQLVGELVD